MKTLPRAGGIIGYKARLIVMAMALASGLGAAAAIVVSSGCSATQRAQTETTLAKALVSDQQSIELGKQLHKELDTQGVKYVHDSDVTGYVEGVAARIFDLARKDRTGIDYHVHVIDDPKTVNAFATPGGHIYVYSGLLLQAENEAELAGVLGHETGHVAGRHVERAMVNAYGVEALSAVALGKNPSMAAQLAASLAGTGVMSAHSRSEETEADEYGARYLSALGYQPEAMITFFRKLQASEGSTPRAMAWLQTHPVTQDRISHLKDYIRDNRLRGTELGESRYASMRSQVPGKS